MTTYSNPFTGQQIDPANVGYVEYSISANVALEWPINGNDQSTSAAIIDINALNPSLAVAMPPAAQVSTGQAALVRNIGANSFSLTDNSGNRIVSIASGLAYFVWVTDNSTVAGTWASVQFGAGVSAANAAALAGNGLRAINTLLNLAVPSTLVSSNYAFGAADRAKFFVWTSGAGTFTLPSSTAAGADWFVIIRNGGSGILTIATQGSDTLDSQSSAQLQPGESFVVVCTQSGIGFNSYAYGRSAQFFFTQLSKVITGGTVTLTAVEAANIVQAYSGTLTSNATVIMPQTVQLYSVANNTNGAFTLAFSTGVPGGATFTLAQGQTAFLVCDGTNIYSATSASVIANTSITLSNGSASAPSLNFSGDNTTGLYLPASGELGIAAGGANVMTISAAGMVVPPGFASGTF